MDIRHDADQHRFVAVLDDGREAGTLTYADRGDALDFLSVFVNPAYRGRGVAAKITAAAFAHARQQRVRVTPTCPYVRDTYLARHPDDHPLTQ